MTPVPDNGIELDDVSDGLSEDEDDMDDAEDIEEEMEGEEHDVDADEEEGGIEEGAWPVLDLT